VVKEARIELNPRVIDLDAADSNYFLILNGPPESVTMRSGLVTLSPGDSVGVHSTKSFEELITVLEGQGEMRFTAHESLPIRAGVALYVPPETEHNVVNTGSGPLRYIFTVAEAMKDEDPVTSDPASVDWSFPPTMVPVAIDSHGSKMNGIIYLAAGPGSHPTVILLHGYPGNERNLDLAQAIRRSGWNVLFFHYRGAWGSEGVFSLDNALEDVFVAIDFLNLPEVQQEHRIDASRIALVGHSMGGYLAIMAGSRMALIKRIAFLAGANMAELSRLAEISPDAVAAIAAELDQAGAIQGFDAQEMIAVIRDDPAKYDLLARVPHLDGKSLLLVGAARDEALSLEQHHLPLVKRIRERNKARLTEAVLDTDHGFSSQRIALARLVADWLTSTIGEDA